MRVRVKSGHVGYIDHKRVREGDVFVIPDEPRRLVNKKELDIYPETKKLLDKDGKVPQLYSSRWMEAVPESTPERITTGKEVLEKFHNETLAERAAQRQADKGDVI